LILPGLRKGPVTNSAFAISYELSQLTAIFNEQRKDTQDRITARASTAAADAVALANTQFEKYFQEHARTCHLQLCQVATRAALPPLYKQLAEVSVSRGTAVMQQRLDALVHQGAWYSRHPLACNAALVQMVVGAKFYHPSSPKLTWGPLYLGPMNATPQEDERQRILALHALNVVSGATAQDLAHTPQDNVATWDEYRRLQCQFGLCAALLFGVKHPLVLAIHANVLRYDASHGDIISQYRVDRPDVVQALPMLVTVYQHIQVRNWLYDQMNSVDRIEVPDLCHVWTCMESSMTNWEPDLSRYRPAPAPLPPKVCFPAVPLQF
jgi:hypothetical protein